MDFLSKEKVMRNSLMTESVYRKIKVRIVVGGWSGGDDIVGKLTESLGEACDPENSHSYPTKHDVIVC